MRKLFSKFAFTAALMLAITLTFSCSGDDGGGNNLGGGDNNSVGNNSGGNNSGGVSFEYGSLPYGDRTYKTIKIGDQTWMAENLDYGDAGLLNGIANATYGKLYNFLRARSVCPPGWHLPNNEEWDILADYAGGATAGTKLKARSGWNGNGNGTDDLGFAALPGGYAESTNVCSTYDPVYTSWTCDQHFGYKYVGEYGGWWSATNDSYRTYTQLMASSEEKTYRNNNSPNLYFSVRCVQD